MNVANWAERQLAEFGDFPALHFGGQTWSSRQLHEASSRLAQGLLELDLEPGETVILHGPNSPDLLILFTATLRAGGVAVILGDGSPQAEVERILEETEARLVFSDLTLGYPRSGFLRWPELDRLQQAAALTQPVARDPEDPAQVVYTSGSSGLAQAVVWSHGVVASRYLAFAEKRPASAPPRRSLVTLPLAGAFGTQYLYLRLLQKMELVLLPRYHPETVVQALLDHGIETAMLVPSMAEALLNSAHARGLRFPKLRSLLLGGSTVSPSLIERLHKGLGVRTASVYGLTELGPVARTNLGDSSGSLGQFAPEIEVRLCPDPEDPEVGEILLRAPGRQGRLLASATGEGEQTEGWIATGDLAYEDESGHLHLVGRRHDRIVTGGTNVYPQPLEELLLTRPEVADCAVVGAPDPYLGEEVVAWVVPTEGHQISDLELLAICRSQLDPKRCPTRIYLCPDLPRSPSGKIDRRELQQLAEDRRQQPQTTELAQKLILVNPRQRSTLLRALLEEQLRGLLGPELEGELHPERPLADLGLDSLSAVVLANSLSAALGLNLPSTLTFEHPTIEALVSALQPSSTIPQEAQGPAPVRPRPAKSKEVALIGVACRLPGGLCTPEQFWDFLGQGRTLSEPIERWPIDRFYDPRPGVPGKTYTKRASLLEEDPFDGELFGLSPLEVEGLNPQHRLLLEVGWEALERSGYAPRSQGETGCGVFLGLSPSPIAGPDPLGNLPSMGVGRLAHLLDLRGPVLALDTACSSGLVAVQTAMLHLRTGQCRMALAGAVHLIESPRSLVALSQLRVLAPDGRCKPFRAQADGFGRGEACVVFVLKLLEEALEDRDPILGVLKGAAVQHDGRSSSLTSPSVRGQREVARTALADAGLRAQDLHFLETHGSGTPLGDGIELQAAAEVYGGGETPLLLGAVKAQVGHAEIAAGAVGLLHALLVVSQGEVPPQPDLGELHPNLKALEGQLILPLLRTPLPLERPLRAAVTSLGMGGTNAVVVLEGPPLPQTESEVQDASALFCLSAASPGGLERLRRSTQEQLAKSPSRAWDLGFTSALGREHFPYRLAVVGSTAATLAEGLSQAPWTRAHPEPKLAFLFTGQGSLQAGAGCQLIHSEPVFRQALVHCDRVLKELTCSSFTMLEALQDGAPGASHQAVHLALGWSLSELWKSWGIEADLLLGHSLGEYLAACVAGVFSLEDGLNLLLKRGALMDTLPPGGGMTAVWAAEETVQRLLQGRPLVIAAVNGPQAVVVSGHRDPLQALELDLSGQGLAWSRLPVTTAFHSPLLEPILDEYAAALSKVRWNKPETRVISTVSGAMLTAEEACSVDFWRSGVRKPVLFQQAVETLLNLGVEACLEVGPHPVLCGLGANLQATRSRVPQQNSGSVGASLEPSRVPDLRPLWLGSLRRGEAERESLLGSLGELYQLGWNPNWQQVYRDRAPRRVLLPTYPFGHKDESTQLEVDAEETSWLQQLAARIVGAPPGSIAPDDHLLESGFDSLRVMQFLAEVGRRLGRVLQPGDLLARPTLAEFEAFLEEGDKTGGPLVCLQQGGLSTPLFCLHPAGGHITVYERLRKRCSERPLFALESRGLRDPQDEHLTLKAMLDDYAGLIDEAQPKGPLALLGWSFGASLAHGLGSRLEQQGRKVEVVVMIDPPHGPLEEEELQALLSLLHTYSLQPPTLTTLRARCSKVPLESLYENCLGEGWLTLETLGAEQFQAYLQLYRHHLKILQEFGYGELQAPVVLCWAEKPQNWSVPLTRGPCRELVLGGDHYSVVRPPLVERIPLDF